jgi:hypothetical protein
MVRLPARLTSKLARARIAQILNSAPRGALLHCVNPGQVLHPGSAAPVSRDKLRALLENPAPVIWIGGSEPLHHAGIGHFVRASAQSGHCVFLETDGTALRRRIHEFQPLRELFLTVGLNSLEAPDPDFAIEGLRAARLSGFFTVIHSRVHADFDSTELATLRSFIKEKDIDGWLITAASSDQDAIRRAAEARGLIPCCFWRHFSEHVEGAFLLQTITGEFHHAQALVSESLRAEADEEGVRTA